MSWTARPLSALRRPVLPVSTLEVITGSSGPPSGNRANRDWYARLPFLDKGIVRGLRPFPSRTSTLPFRSVMMTSLRGSHELGKAQSAPDEGDRHREGALVGVARAAQQLALLTLVERLHRAGSKLLRLRELGRCSAMSFLRWHHPRNDLTADSLALTVAGILLSPDLRGSFFRCRFQSRSSSSVIVAGIKGTSGLSFSHQSSKAWRSSE